MGGLMRALDRRALDRATGTPRHRNAAQIVKKPNDKAGGDLFQPPPPGRTEWRPIKPGNRRRNAASSWPPPQQLPSEGLHALADHCEAAARRLETTGQEPDRKDAAALRGAAEIHRAAADAAYRKERDAATPTYWWQDRD